MINDEEKASILNSYAWIKVPRLEERNVDSSCDWKEEYFKLLEHHKKETEFLITKVREIVIDIDNDDIEYLPYPKW